jgi:hypothetical protein
MIYLASPYTHENENVMENRYDKTRKVTEFLLSRGLPVYSSIVYGHHLKLPHMWEFWKAFDLDMITLCDIIIVLTLDGWKESIGVQAEIEHAKSLGRVILYIEEIT